jgi:signal peptidase I
MVVFLWHFVWDAALIVTAIATIPVTSGLIPRLLGYSLLVGALSFVAFVIAGYVGMSLVARGDPSRASWIAPTVMNAVLVLVVGIYGGLGPGAIAFVAALAVTAGMWLRLSRQPGVPLDARRLALVSVPALLLVVTGVALIALGSKYYSVRTSALAPAIRASDVVVSARLARAPQRGDFVVLDDPRVPHATLIRSVGGTGGESVSARGGLSTVVPIGRLWLAAAAGSGQPDSNDFGPQPTAAIKGSVVAVVWPLTHMQLLLR